MKEDQDRPGIRSPTLYVVATPIGNLADITLRALETLKSVDLVAAEDTRITARLLERYGIATPLMSLHEHNERRAAHKLLALLAEGKSVALVSDAGTPAISDPGAAAVALAREHGYAVVPLPGANAAITALCAAGLMAQHFLFYGFLPHGAAARRRALEALKELPYLLVFHESPHRVEASVADMAEILGPGRSITIAREVTKLFETFHTCALGEAGAWLGADANRIKGEFVLLVDGAPAERGAGAEEARRILAILLDELPLKQAVKLAAAITGAPRNDLYAAALESRGAKAS